MSKVRPIPIERNNLPNIHRRRQGGGSVKFGKFSEAGRNMGWKKREYLPTSEGTVYKWQDTYDFRFEFDNPEYGDTEIVNGELHWKRKEVTNLDATSRFVVNHNHPHRSSARFLGLYAKAYCEGLAHFNICYRCYQPFKVKRATVPSGATLEQVSKAIDWLSAKTRKKNISVYDERGQFALAYERQGIEWNATTHKTNVTYCDLTPHYEVRQRPDGSLVYVFVDGSGEDKIVKVTQGYFEGETQLHAVEKREYSLLDGTPLPNYFPPTTYRVFNVYCDCKAVRPK